MRKRLNVKALRKHLQLNQDDIAESIGLLRSTYSNYERTETFPEHVINDIEAVYSKEIAELGTKIMVDEVDSNTISSLQNRIAELELLLNQKDSIITNQHQVIEMQNQTYLALKQQYEKR